MSVAEVRAQWKKWQLANADKAKAIGKTFCDMAITQSWAEANDLLVSAVVNATGCSRTEAYDTMRE